MGEEGLVVCKQLGFPGVSEATVESRFGRTLSNYTISRVKCEGNESNILDCPHRTSDSCFGLEAAGVVCSSTEVSLDRMCHKDGAVCLAGGANKGEGKVYMSGHPVCHNGWDFIDANVVCRSLGFIEAADFTIKSSFGPSTTFSRIGQVNCRGQESSLMECPHKTSGDDCDSGTVAGVQCIASVKELPLSPSVDLHAAVIGLSLTAAVLLVLLIGAVFMFLLKTGYLPQKKLNVKNLRTLNMSFKQASFPLMAPGDDDYIQIYMNKTIS